MSCNTCKWILRVPVTQYCTKKKKEIIYDESDKCPHYEANKEICRSKGGES